MFTETRRMHRERGMTTYPVRLSIDTNHGRAETRMIGPTRVIFCTAELFEPGDPLRFAMSLRGTSATALDVFCSGNVRHVTTEGELFLVDATIEETQISVASG
jgi:hypothetical protein